MLIDAFLGLLQNVRSRGAGKYVAKCPAHADRTPSLSITAGDRGILIHCWAGCTTADICGALSLHTHELFYATNLDSRAFRKAQQQRARRSRAAATGGLTADTLREAEAFIASRRGLDISEWSSGRLHNELNALAIAYRLLEAEGRPYE